MRDTNVDELFRKYSKKLEKEITRNDLLGGRDYSQEYMQFKREMHPELSRYERWCKSLGSFIKIKASPKDEIKIQKHLNMAHLDVTPGQALTLSVVILLLSFFAGVLLSLGLFFILDSFPVLLLFLFLMTSLFLFYYFYSMPARLANKWRLKASSQMVPCILYVVVYMKHTSNLERAVVFASQHLQAPLALDFKKILWDVETGKYSTIKESLDAYLETWRKSSPEFVESFHLVESSLYEPSEARRVATLEKSLQVILDGVYERMMKYSRQIRSPLTNLYMLGIILPTLALALLPLASTLVGGLIKWYHVFVLFDLIIPFFVFYMTTQILLKRPGGHGETDLLEMNPLYPKYNSKGSYVSAFILCLPFFLLGILPFLFQTGLPGLVGLQQDYTFSQLGIDYLGEMKIFDFKQIGGSVVGPFGLIAVILSLFIPLSIALFFSIAFSMKTKELMVAREQSKQLEKEFTSSLFQLGNRIGDGMPAEVAFSKVADSSRGTVSENFFRIVNVNLHQAGMSLEQSIFNERRGAIIYYPSALVRMSMKILVESVKKGLQVAARSLMSISEYIKNIHRINERLRDLLAEVVSDMKSNMTFLAPLLAGIVVGLASMITLILNRLEILKGLAGAAGTADIGVNLQTITEFLNVQEMIPPYFLQIAIGIYIIEIIFILTGTLVTVDAGEDKLKRKYDISRFLKFGSLLYLIVALISIFILSILAAFALAGITT